MAGTNIRNGLLSAVAALALVGLPAHAGANGQNAAFETAIDQAKSMMMADSAAALENARRAADLVKTDSLEDQERLLTTQWLEAEALMRLNRADEAAELIDQAIREATLKFNGSKLHADLLRSQASLRMNQSKYGEALSSFLKAHEYYEALGDDRSRAIVLQNIGSLYSDAREYERVLSYYKQANEVYPEDKALALSAHNNTGNALKELNRYVAAEAEFRAALEVAEQMDSPMLEARILTNIASAQHLAGDLDEAEATISRGLNLAYRSAPEWLPFLYGVRAQIAAAQGRDGNARVYIERTFANVDLTTTSPYFRDFHETAFELYSDAKNYQMALAHLEAFQRIDIQARDLSAKANNALLAATFDAANRELEISKLSAQKAANEAKLDKARSQVIFLSLLIGLVVIAFIGALMALRIVNRSREGIRAANQKLTHVIRHDALTELFARDYFREQLENAMAQRAASSRPPILAFIDLDRFKQVNDVYGHAAGDKLLVQVAERFREVAGDDAVIGRLGGDEFAMLMPAHLNLEESIELSEKIIKRIDEFFSIDGFEISIGASIGLTQVDTEANVSWHMTNADLALYTAKDGGRGMCVVYQPSMREKLEDRSSLENDIGEALENGQFTVKYQPIVKGPERSVIACEALMRWTHPERGIVPPDVFIKVAEDCRLIERIGEWGLRTACKEAASWPEDVKLTVNISTLQMSDPSFLNIVTSALASSGLNPNRLILELTESLVLKMDSDIEKVLNSLKSLGVTFALDDFGRGYSSLNYIDKMDFSMIKIDREFVQSAADGSPRSQAVVSAITALAQSLDVEVTAEGIEKADQAEAMERLGCTCLQGYHFGRPSETPLIRPEDGKQKAVA